MRNINQKAICMIAYTDYLFDARVRREAETLSRHGFEVICLTQQNSVSPSETLIDGVLVREIDRNEI